MTRKKGQEKRCGDTRAAVVPSASRGLEVIAKFVGNDQVRKNPVMTHSFLDEISNMWRIQKGTISITRPRVVVRIDKVIHPLVTIILHYRMQNFHWNIDALPIFQILRAQTGTWGSPLFLLKRKGTQGWVLV